MPPLGGMRGVGLMSLYWGWPPPPSPAHKSASLVVCYLIPPKKRNKKEEKRTKKDSTAKIRTTDRQLTATTRAGVLCWTPLAFSRSRVHHGFSAQFLTTVVLLGILPSIMLLCLLLMLLWLLGLLLLAEPRGVRLFILYFLFKKWFWLEDSLHLWI